MTLYFFDNVLLLHLSFKSAKGVLDGLALLQFYFCQFVKTPPTCPLNDPGYFVPLVSENHNPRYRYHMDLRGKVKPNL